MKTLIKIQFNKRFNHYEALTAAANLQGVKLHKFGNDFNIYAATREACKNKCLCYVQTGLIDSNFQFIN